MRCSTSPLSSGTLCCRKYRSINRPLFRLHVAVDYRPVFGASLQQEASVSEPIQQASSSTLLRAQAIPTARIAVVDSVDAVAARSNSVLNIRRPLDDEVPIDEFRFEKDAAEWFQKMITQFTNAISQCESLAERYNHMYFNSQRHGSRALTREHDLLAGVSLCLY